MGSNNDIVNQGFDILLPSLAKHVAYTLFEKYEESWWNVAVLNNIKDYSLIQSGTMTDYINCLDIQKTFTIIKCNWDAVFKDFVNSGYPCLTRECRTYVFELSDIRNKISHRTANEMELSDRDAMRALDTMSRLCKCIDAKNSVKIDELYDKLLKGPSSSSESSNSDIDIEKQILESSDVYVPKTMDIVTDIDVSRLVDSFEGCIVRKDLTKKIKEGANVPIFVLEYLLGIYCSTNDPGQIEEAMQIVRDKLSRLYFRPDEAEKVKSNIREAGEGYSIIDKVTVHLDYKKDIYRASFLTLGLRDVPIHSSFVVDYPRLLSGGIWAIITFDYSFLEEDTVINPFKITRLSPIQMPSVDVEEYCSQRSKFSKDEWISLMLRSIGIEPSSVSDRSKWLLMARMAPLVENNVNLCELGPRSTGKSHIYKEISPSSILVSGGQATVASLFFNLSTRTPGLVCNWDVVAFDEVAEIRFKDKDAIGIMKDYMNSGSFSRGGEHLDGKASMVFVGNINESIPSLLLQSSLFAPFPVGMNDDVAFLDRFHCYIPGWEIEPFTPQTFTNDYGFICDYIAEITRELRKYQYSGILDQYFTLHPSLKQRDVAGIKKMFSAMVKIIYPDGVVQKEDAREILEFVMEMRARVKEQLKRIKPDDEFMGTRFIYIDNDTQEEKEVLVPECVGLESRQGAE